MTRTELIRIVTNIVSQATGIPADEIDPSSDFITELCLDSLAIIEVIVDLENRFKTEISDELSERMHDINDVVDYIEINNLADKL